MESIKEALFNKYADGDTKNLVENLCFLVEKYSDKAIAEKMNTDIVGLTMKIVLLFGKKKIELDDLNDLRVAFRKMCASIVNSYRIGTFIDSLPRIEKNFQIFQKELEIMLKKHSKKSVILIQETCDIIATTKFFDFAYSKEPQVFKNVVFTLAYYLEVTS